MARPQRPATTESKNVDFTTHFETITGPVQLNGEKAIKGVAAAVSLDPHIHIIITAPSFEVLRKAWHRLNFNDPLDEKKAQFVIEALVGKLDYSVTEPSAPKGIDKDDYETKPTVSKVMHSPNAKPWLWFIHPESECCFIDEISVVDRDPLCVDIGPAVECTEAECIALLRKNRVPRDAINKMNISCDTSNLIPF